MRERIEKFLRIVLLAMSFMAIVGPAVLGVGMVFITLVFCDSGPLQRCAAAGAMFLGGLGLCAALPVPVVVALIRQKSQLDWYMYVYPFLMLALACVAYAEGAAAMGMTKIIFEYVGLALVAFAYLGLRHVGAKRGASAS